MKAVEAVLDKRNVEIIDLLSQQISHYDYENRNKDDDFISIAKKMVNSDIIVFATPVYWYSMSGHLKVFFDRLTDLLSVHKDLGRALKGKECWMISSGTGEKLPLGFEQVFASTANYFDMIYKDYFYYHVMKDEVMPEKTRKAAKNFGKQIFSEGK